MSRKRKNYIKQTTELWYLKASSSFCLFGVTWYVYKNIQVVKSSPSCPLPQARFLGRHMIAQRGSNPDVFSGPHWSVLQSGWNGDTSEMVDLLGMVIFLLPTLIQQWHVDGLLIWLNKGLSWSLGASSICRFSMTPNYDCHSFMHVSRNSSLEELQASLLSGTSNVSVMMIEATVM